MKKVLLPILSLLLILTFSNINAQTHFAVGARAGLNIANLSFDPDLPSGVTKTSRTGFLFGGLAEIGFTPMIAIQFEPMFVTGAGSELSATGGKSTLKLSYFEFPILFKFKVPVSGPVMPYVFAGPNIGFVTSSKEVDEITGVPNGTSETDLKDFVTSTNFALDFGAGAGFAVTPLTVIVLDVRYSLGLTNALNDKGKQSVGFNSVKSTGFQIVAGVMFGL